MIERTIVAGLAATRLIRAWRFEEIGKKPRTKLVAWLQKPVINGNELNVGATLRRDWVRELVECPHCLGAWVALGCAVGVRDRRLLVVLEGMAAAMILSTFVQWFPGFAFEEPDPKEIVVAVKDADAEEPAKPEA